MIEVVGWLLYAIPMLAIVLAPDAVRPRVRATVAGVAVVAAPVVLLVGTLGGEQGDRARRSPAAAARRTVNVAITDEGCAPATLKLASGADHLRRHQQGLVEGDRVRGRPGRAATLAEVENVTDGLTKRFSLTLQPGRYTLRCTGAEHENASLTVSGARADAGAGARRCSAASTATAPSSSARPPRW